MDRKYGNRDHPNWSVMVVKELPLKHTKEPDSECPLSVCVPNAREPKERRFMGAKTRAPDPFEHD